MKASRYFFVVAALAVLAGCPAASNTPTYTVNGTVTLNSMSETGNLIVTVSQGSNSYAASVVAGTGPYPYSISGVPAGTYSVTLNVVGSSCSTVTSTVFLNTAIQGSSVTQSSPYILTAPSITISGNAELDATMSGGGCF